MRIGLRELTFFLLLLGFLAGTGYLVFLPHWQKIEQINRDNQAKQARLVQLDRLGQRSENLSRELTELAKALAFFESKLPNDQQIHVVLRKVTQITDKHALTTKSVRTLKQVESADYVAQPIEMEISGPFEGLYQFLLDLEKLPRITRIGQLELTKDKVGEGLVQAKFIISVYFEPSNRSGLEPMMPSGPRTPAGAARPAAAYSPPVNARNISTGGAR